MKISCLHVNIERSKHINLIDRLLSEKRPEIICLSEVIDTDLEKFAKDHDYHYAFGSEISYANGSNQGVAILSKHNIIETNMLRYDENNTTTPPVISFIERHDTKDRPEFRFHYHSVLLVATINKDDQQLTIATAHFPIADHSTYGDDHDEDHSLDETEDIHDINYVRGYFDRLMTLIRHLSSPLIFTSDLNNPRGEYMYDALAHELFDQVPQDITTTMDPKIHRVKNIQLVVDTIMTSPDISCSNFEVIDGVSDHKALLAELTVG